MAKRYSLQLAIDFTPMPHVMHDHLFEVFVHAVDDAVIAYADAIQVFRASQLGRLPWKWLVF